MLKELTLKNFKAFRQQAVVPLAPITLIFGENSAGKSTIVQTLCLMKQSMEQARRGPYLLFKPRQALVNLGTYADAVYGCDAGLPITLGAAVAEGGQLHRLEFEFAYDLFTGNGLLERISLFCEDRSFLARLERVDEVPKQRLQRVDHSWLDYPQFGRGVPFRGTRLSGSEQYWRDSCEAIKGSLVVLEDASLGGGMGGPLALDPETGRLTSPWDGPFTVIESIPQEMRDGRFSVGQFIDWLTRSFLDSYFDFREPFRPAAMLCALPVPEAQNPAVRLREGCEALCAVLARLVPLGPVRSGPRRWYEHYDLSAEHVGYEGGYALQLLLAAPEELEQVNYWLDHLGIGYKLVVQPFGADLLAVKLVDTRSGGRIAVSMADVGYGVSQVLPIIAQSVISKDALITIEQPELHIHPRLQAELGDLFAAAVKAPYRNQFIIETHSEHLILRLQRLVRTGVLTPEDISVLYVLRGEGERGSEVIQLHLDPEGDFIDEWPGGFFPERLQELL